METTDQTPEQSSEIALQDRAPVELSASVSADATLDPAPPQMPTAKAYAAGLVEDCTTLLITLHGMNRKDAVETLRCAAAELSVE